MVNLNKPGLFKSDSSNPVKSLLQVLPILLLTGFFFYHWFLIWTYAVNVPFLDEWDEFPRHPVWAWLFAPHNEHRIVTTKLLVLALWQLDGWDIATHQLLNFPIFGATLLVLGAVLRFAVRSLPVWVLALILLYCLSPMSSENHVWGFQTQWHLMLLFLFGGAYFWFSAPEGKQRWPQLLLGSLAFVLGLLTLSAGIAIAAAMVLLFAIFKVRRALACTSNRKQEFVQLVGAALPVVLAIGTHFATYTPVPGAIKTTLPIHLSYWQHFLVLIASGSGLMLKPPYVWIAGFITVFLIGAPWLIVLWRKTKQPVPSELWVLAAITFGLLAALSAISMGRASMGPAQALESRYTEFTVIMIPLILSIWWWTLGSNPRRQAGVFTLAGVILTILFVSSFQYFDHYAEQHRDRTRELSVIRAQYGRVDAYEVPYLYPAPIPAQRFKEAEEMQLSFLKQVR